MTHWKGRAVCPQQQRTFPGRKPEIREQSRRAENSRHPCVKMSHKLKQRGEQTGHSAVHFAEWPCLPKL